MKTIAEVITKTLLQEIEDRVPQGTRCDGCPFSGEGRHCGLLGEVAALGEKICAINDPRDYLELFHSTHDT